MASNKNLGRGAPRPTQLPDDLVPLGPVNGQPPNRAARRTKRVSSGRRGIGRQLERLAGNQIGYYADPLRADDCLRAAVATATQTPIEQVPDLRLQARLNRGDDPDEISESSWLRIAEWAERRGLQMMLHEEHEVPADRERWIGVIVVPFLVRLRLEALPQARPFIDHCVVMSYGEIFFDPAATAIAPRAMRVQTWEPGDVTFGLSFDPIDPKKE